MGLAAGSKTKINISTALKIVFNIFHQNNIQVMYKNTK